MLQEFPRRHARPQGLRPGAGVAIASLLAACSGGAISAGPDAAAPDARAEDAAADGPAPLCTVAPVSQADLCEGACPLVRATRVTCRGQIAGYDLAVSRAGRVYLMPTSDSGEVLLVDVPAEGDARITSLGKRGIAVLALAGPEEEPRVFTSEGPDGDPRLHRPGATGWPSEPVKFQGVFQALAANAAGQVLIFGSEGDLNEQTVVVTRLPEGTVERLPSIPAFLSHERFFVDGAGNPVVLYVVKGSSAHRLSAAGDQEIARWPEPVIAPMTSTLGPRDLPLFAWVNPQRRLVLADGAQRSEVLEGATAQPWTTPACGGGYTAYAPEVCKANLREMTKLGDRLTWSHGLAAGTGGVFVAAASGDMEVGCRTSGQCFETRPCDCREHDYEDVLAQRLRLRALGDHPRDVVLKLAAPSEDPGIRLVAGEGSRVYMTWLDYDQLTVALFDLR